MPSPADQLFNLKNRQTRVPSPRSQFKQQDPGRFQPPAEEQGADVVGWMQTAIGVAGIIGGAFGAFPLAGLAFGAGTGAAATGAKRLSR